MIKNPINAGVSLSREQMLKIKGGVLTFYAWNCYNPSTNSYIELCDPNPDPGPGCGYTNCRVVNTCNPPGNGCGGITP